MSSAPELLPRVEHLARQIEQDIRRRKLAAGASYLTADEVGRMFGVHSRTAHRAMTRLATQQILVRRRGAGTVIGPALGEASTAGVVHVLVPARRFEQGVGESNLPAAVLSAIPRHLPRASVQFNILPGAGTAADARQALSLTFDSGLAAGVILVGCGRDIQEHIQGSEVPAVVFGGTFATTTGLASVDADQRLLGRLLAERLVRRGHRKVAVLMHETWLPGDNDYFEAISEVLASAGASCVVRSLPLDPTALRVEAEMFLSADAATAAICRTRRRYGLFADALRELTALRGDAALAIEAVFDDTEFCGSAGTAYACVAEPMSEQIDRVAGVLFAVSHGERPDRTVLPVRLVEPDSAEDGGLSISENGFPIVSS